MDHARRTTVLALVSLALLLPSLAIAQVNCLEGKTSSGNCVNVGLAAAMRQTAIVFSQPKISETAFPILPADDLRYRYPNQLIPSPLKPAPAYAPSP